MYNDLKSYELMLLESEVFEKQILGSMYEDLKNQFPEEAKKIVDDYTNRKSTRPNAYCKMRELMNKRVLK